MRMLIASVLLAAALPAIPDYQPPGWWHDAHQQAFYAQWFGDQLAAMHEPVLWTGPAPARGVAHYRLLVLPSFRPARIVRIDVDRDTATVTTTILDGAGGYRPGRIAATATRPLAPGTLAEVRRQLVLSRFADRAREAANATHNEFGKPVPPPHDLAVICMDGTQYLIEARTADGYRAITRHDCELTTETTALVVALQGAAGGTGAGLK